MLGIEELGFCEHPARRVVSSFGEVTGFHWEQVVCPGDGDSVASEVEEAHIRSAKLIPKFQQCGEELVAGDVVFLNDGEAECAEGFGHRLGVIHGVA